jgi:hypothetical protein
MERSNSPDGGGRLTAGCVPRRGNPASWGVTRHDEGEKPMAMKKSPPTLTKPWLSVTDIRDSLSRAREFGAQHARQIADLNGRVAKRREELDATLSDLPPSQRMQIVGRALGGLRADLKRTSLDHRTARLRDLDALRRRVDDAKTHYNSSIQMLMRDNLGSERRSRLIQQLEHSGSVELASLAALAASSKDRELGAVLVSRVNRMPHGERPFSAQELADLIVGDEFRAVQAAVMEVEDIAGRAMLEDRAFETGRAVGESTIGLALRGRERAELGVADDALDTIADQEI